MVIKNLFANDCFDFVLMAKLCWSKNVIEEHKYPQQIMFVLMTWESCLFIALGLYLEISIMTHGSFGENPFIFNFGKPRKGENAVLKANEFCQSVLRKTILPDPAFQKKIQGSNIGYHF